MSSHYAAEAFDIEQRKQRSSTHPLVPTPNASTDEANSRERSMAQIADVGRIIVIMVVCGGQSYGAAPSVDSTDR